LKQQLGLGTVNNKKPIILCGHSSGSNICALALIECFQKNFPSHVDLFIGLSGVYDIEQHYEFESNRKVQNVSPMGAAAQGPDNFWECSPTLVINRMIENEHFMYKLLTNSQHRFPFVGLIHGEEDKVVPHTSSMQFEDSLVKLGVRIECRYPENYDHIAPLIHILGQEDNDTINSINYIWKKYLLEQPQGTATV